MILHDQALRLALGRELHLDPCPPKSALQPASIDLRLGPVVLALKTGVRCLDAREPQEDAWAPIAWVYDGLVMPPGAFWLGATLERVTLSTRLVAQLTGKSSLARMGLQVEAAGWVDPGWTNGALTLELHNVAPVPLKLYREMAVAQLTVFRLAGESRGYQGHYQGAQGPEASRAALQWREGVDGG